MTRLIQALSNNTVIPLDIWKLVFTYTFDLRCILHEEKYSPISQKEVDYDFCRFLIQTSRTNTFKDIHLFIPRSETSYLFEDCFLFNQLECAQLVYTVFRPRIFVQEFLQHAVQDCSASMVSFLLDTDYFDSTPVDVFGIALKRGDPKILLALLDHPKTDCLSLEDDNQTLISAIELQKYELVSMLVAHSKIDAHLHDNEPFLTAMYLEDKVSCGILWDDPFVKRTLCLPSEAHFYPYREIIMSICI